MKKKIRRALKVRQLKENGIEIQESDQSIEFENNVSEKNKENQLLIIKQKLNDIGNGVQETEDAYFWSKTQSTQIVDLLESLRFYKLSIQNFINCLKLKQFQGREDYQILLNQHPLISKLVVYWEYCRLLGIKMDRQINEIEGQYYETLKHIDFEYSKYREGQTLDRVFCMQLQQEFKIYKILNEKNEKIKNLLEKIGI